MHTSKEVCTLLQPADYGIIIDLSDAYYLVKLHQSSRKYCRFIVDGVIYEHVALPMELTCSARDLLALSFLLVPDSEGGE